MSDTIESLLVEQRLFVPSDEFRAQAHVQDESIYQKAAEDPVGFWEGWAQQLEWFEPWNQALEWKVPFAKWFVSGKLNASVNCLDRHVRSRRGDKVAFYWEGEPGDERVLTYRQVLEEVCRISNGLRELGVQRGDRVCIYMPMVPELPMTMLACARLGAAHSVVFGGFSADALSDRIEDAQAKVVVTADGGWRRGMVIPLKKTVDDALASGCPSIKKCLVLERIGAPGENAVYDPGKWVEGRDVWWHDLVPNQSSEFEPEQMDSEDLLFILYTSGSTGKPKGIMHTTGGYMTGVTATAKLVFDLKEDDIYWCTADCGWVTGHSYIVYGPMSNGVTQVIYEGAPDFPSRDRLWRTVQKYRATIFYTAPTAIRTFMKWGEDIPAAYDLSSLRLLGTVGEPINPEAWVWYHKHIGGGRCPVVDTWWQTETGAIMIAPLPGVVPGKPGSATRPFPGVAATVYNDKAEDVVAKLGTGGGYLVLTQPWPSMLRGIWGNPQRYHNTYWLRFGNAYFAGDGAKVDEDGYFWLLGRVDDVMLVAGHNISTMEVESALVDHPAVAEAAVIGRTHEVKGQAISAFVILRGGVQTSPELEREMIEHVVRRIGPIARPEELIVSAELPKTRSGKIMRRLLRDVAEGRALGDTTTLADPAVVEGLKDKYESD